MRMAKRVLALAAAMALVLGLLSACGSKLEAATMHLKRTEGTVGVSDGEGKDLEPAENLGLFSGYGVGTKGASYAWIDLDSVKLTKMDENSEIEIKKDGKKLAIEVKSGSLFFNVTEPLAEDETLDIRTSTMVVGIRGTCGWVTQDTAALLEGTVSVTAGENTATVSAGEMAVLTEEGTLEVRPFTAASVPAFVSEELDSIPEEIPEEISEEVPDASFSGPYTVLLKEYSYRANGVLMYTYEYFYDEQGYMQRVVRSAYNNKGNLVGQEDAFTCDYDKETGRVLCTAYSVNNVRTFEIPYKPGTPHIHSGFSYGEEYIVVDPLVTTMGDRRDWVGPGGRVDSAADTKNDFYNRGYYAIYTMDEDGYPIHIDTYKPDDVLSGSTDLEWGTIG